jgi:hypothetical protein
MFLLAYINLLSTSIPNFMVKAMVGSSTRLFFILRRIDSCYVLNINISVWFMMFLMDHAMTVNKRANASFVLIFRRRIMNTTMMRNFRNNNNHPVLAAGNFIEGTLGILAVATAIYSIITYGWAASLILSLLYTVAVTIIAFKSAYHLI